MKIAITGATGQLGTLVIQALLQGAQSSGIQAQDIVALVRNKDKATALTSLGIQLRHFDYDQADMLAPALDGVDKLLLISANEVGRRTPQHQAVIQAAIEAGVPYIAYTSLLNASDSPLGLAQEHRETEQLIRDSGLKYTFLRNNWYSENYLASIEHVIAQGVLYGSAQDGRISAASRAEYAQAAARVMASSGHEDKVYELAASQSFSLSELAQAIGSASGTEVRYQNLSPTDYQQALTQAGLPAGLVDVIVDADVHTVNGAMYSARQDLEQLLGHPTQSIADRVKQIVQKN